MTCCGKGPYEEDLDPHIHDWQPWKGHVAQYRCGDCGCSGYRATFGPNKGQIVAHKESKKFDREVTARSAVGQNRTGHKLPASSVGNRKR